MMADECISLFGYLGHGFSTPFYHLRIQSSHCQMSSYQSEADKTYNQVEGEKHKDLDGNLFIFPEGKKSGKYPSKENSPASALFSPVFSFSLWKKSFQIHTKWYIHCLLFCSRLQMYNLSGHHETLFWNMSQSVFWCDNEITRQFSLWHDWIRL